VDEARLSGGFDLSSQMPDVNVERIGCAGEVEAPDVTEDCGAREDLSRVGEKELEQPELRQGELDRTPRIDDLACSRVEQKIGEPENIGPRRAFAAEKCAEARK
jgi:hypothetical protein